MEDRYEIKGRIGQGGLGSVYRAYDTRMNREVAIKRISTTSNDPELLEESTRQLIKEAGALASLQHPHIVTIYDVGTDEEGPYVVMELLSGKPLDELIETAPLVWSDFYELVIQTQEGLIAAQDLGIIHSDLKPSNLMLSWLPSGKFQVKIVDFGLASVSQTQSNEELETLDAVFGSIFFMPPEQFERKPLDVRSDVYSMGCVYYQALAGEYPFNGTTGNEVMDSHLAHSVVHLREYRKDLPHWVCEWVMWQINRNPEDRPQDSREALALFLQNEKNPAQPAPERPKRPPLMIPGSGPAKKTTAALPARTIADSDPTGSPKIKTATAPQALVPPDGAKPSIYIPIDEPTPTSPAVTQPVITRHIPPPKKMSAAAKLGITLALLAVTLCLGFFLLQETKKRQEREYLNSLITQSTGSESEIPLSAADLNAIFKILRDPQTPKAYAEKFFRVLQLGNNDTENIDARIVAEATKPEFPEYPRNELFANTLRLRKNPEIVAPLIEFAKTTDNAKSAAAAMEGIRQLAPEDKFSEIIEALSAAKSMELRAGAEMVALNILSRSKTKDTYVAKIVTAYKAAGDELSRSALMRIARAAGGQDALDQLR